MGKWIDIHPDRIKHRQIDAVVSALQSGGIAIIPTDSSYVLVCTIGNSDAITRIRILRQLDNEHHFTLLCRGLSDLAVYAEVSNPAFRFIKSHIPGPYTFVLQATKAVPKKLRHAKRKTIGLRVPDHPVTQAILQHFNGGLLSVSLQHSPETDGYHDILSHFKDQVDWVIDSGCLNHQTTIVDYTEDYPQCLRRGAGEVDWDNGP